MKKVFPTISCILIGLFIGFFLLKQYKKDIIAYLITNFIFKIY